MSFKMENFIAEIGVNHEGSMSNAKLMIDQCKACGVGVVKFQSYTAEKLAAEDSPAYWDLSKEPTKNQRELFAKHDSFSIDDYYELARYCKDLGIEFLSTPFDEDWVDILDPLIHRYKIASVDLTNFLLLEKVASKQKPIILSVGASTLTEIDSTLDFLKRNGVIDITLLHCIINYPTDLSNCGLGQIYELKKRYNNLKIGYSDHTIPSESKIALPLAIALGASVIEKHYTFDRNLKGNDHYHAFDFASLRDFSESLSSINDALKNVDLGYQDISRKYARRGLYASRKLEAGHILKKSDFIALRPKLNFISPMDFETVIGKTLRSNIEEGEGISFTDVSGINEKN